MSEDPKSGVQHDPEFGSVSGWKNPYVLYIFLMLALFLFLVGAGYMALKNGWIPSR